ncbi:MAG: class I SAM-dependent methyltransferase [Deltaproteobacteria bacterium]|nr:class I SAM-dependent methyltransferase [Deltaproteobacteria bacterium]MBW2122806.1 class I SAM-dependent methyltransferase [Deltaproteobacteria bacterium]
MNTVRDYFDSLAPGWNGRYQRRRDYRNRAAVFAMEIERERGAGNVETILEIGCGACGVLGPENDDGISYFGCDLSFRMLRLNPRRGKIFQADLLKMPVKGRFDMVVMSSVLEWMGDPLESPGILSGLLRPGGILLVSYPNTRGLFRIVERRVVRPLRRALKGSHYTDLQKVKDYGNLKRAFQKHGFRLKRAVFFGKKLAVQGRYSSSMELDVYQYRRGGE